MHGPNNNPRTVLLTNQFIMSFLSSMENIPKLEARRRNEILFVMALALTAFSLGIYHGNYVKSAFTALKNRLVSFWSKSHDQQPAQVPKSHPPRIFKL